MKLTAFAAAAAVIAVPMAVQGAPTPDKAPTTQRRTLFTRLPSVCWTVHTRRRRHRRADGRPGRADQPALVRIVRSVFFVAGVRSGGWK